jgi:hypothetical protein
VDNIALMLQVGGALVAVASAFAVAKWRVGKVEEDLGDMKKKLAALEKEFHEYQLTATEKFVSTTAFGKIEEAINRLTNRIDLVVAERRAP